LIPQAQEKADVTRPIRMLDLCVLESGRPTWFLEDQPRSEGEAKLAKYCGGKRFDFIDLFGRMVPLT